MNQTIPSTLRRLLTPYVAIWSALALVAIVYISVAVARPDLLNQASSDPGSEETTFADAEQLKRELAAVEQELARTKAENAERLAEEKTKLDPFAPQEQPTPSSTHPVTEAANTDAETVSTETTTAAVPTPVPTTAEESTPTDPNSTVISEQVAGTKILNRPLSEDTSAATETAATVAKTAAENAAAKDAGTAITNTAVPDTAPKAATNVTTLNKTAAVADNKVADTQVAAKKEVIEKAPPATEPAVKTATTETKPTTQKVAALAKPVPKPTPKPAPKPAAKPVTKTNVQTGSLGAANAKPIDFGPAVVTRATRPIGVRIATGPSIDSLRLSWSALADRHGSTLRKLEPRYVTGIDATGLTYDLIAGPFNTADEATEVCLRLHANGARCALGEFTGNAL
ncbi:MAG: hypothetical protein K0U34_03015 [Alphaproteobacteria bacterium]|nr:hypothetical protein [Alphaproteobacteria bacterium]